MIGAPPKAGYILCDYCAISARYQLTLYKKIACNCDVKTKLTISVLTLYGPIVECQLCAHTIRMKHSGCACAIDDTIYGRQPEIKTNKQKKNYRRYREDLTFPINVLNYDYYYGILSIKCIGLLQCICTKITVHFRTTEVRIIKH